MDELTEYYMYATAAFILFTFLFTLVTLGYVRRISKHFSTKKFKINAFYEIDSVSKDETFVLSFYNTSVTDAIVTSLGFMYKDQNVDLYNMYCEANEEDPDKKIIIPTNGSITMKIEYETLKGILINLNGKEYDFKKIRTYTIDSSGNVSKRNAKIVRKILRTKVKKEYLIKRAALKLQNKEEKEHNKLEKQKENAIIKEQKEVAKAAKNEEKAKVKETNKLKRKEKREVNKAQRRKKLKSATNKTGLFFKRTWAKISNFFRKIFKKKKETQ